MVNPASQKVQQPVFNRVARMKRGSVCSLGGNNMLAAPLSKEDEHEALLRMNEGDSEKRNILIEHNLRLVVYIARKFSSTKLDIEDLLSIGTIGLIKAVNSFNIEKNVKLATFASRCIENEILMALRRASRLQWEVSLDVPVYSDWDGNEMLLSDVLSTDANPVSRDLDDNEFRLMLYGAIQMLSINERKIIDLRFGLYSGLSHTQNEVARMLGISQSYVSRIEKKIYRKLKTYLLS